MKKIIVMFITLFMIIVTVHSDMNNDKFWKRHFFDISFSIGYSFDFYLTSLPLIDFKYQVSSYATSNSGFNTGFSFGYQFGISKYFAIGPGCSINLVFLFPLQETYYFNPQYLENEKAQDREYPPTGNDNGDYHFNPAPFGAYSGGTIMLNLMIGDLYDKKIAFLLDVGGGWLFAAKMGIYVKGITIKLGYHCTFYFAYHNICIDIGYKFNWKRKI